MVPSWFRSKHSEPPAAPPPQAATRTSPRPAAVDAAGPWPRFPGPFGGLWVDLSNAPAIVDGKRELGLITPEEARQLRSFIENGFVIFEKAVSPSVLDEMEKDVERAKKGKYDSVHVEHWVDGNLTVSPSTRELWSRELVLPKVHDLHSASPAARRASFAPVLRRFLELIFERPALAFQSLQFTHGSEQPMHQDSAYVVVESPRELAASWIALEDIAPDSGELEYYVGSHRLEDFLWCGKFKAKPFEMPVSDPEHAGFLQHLHDASAARGLKRQQFRPKRGDALIWHADLAHGGSKVGNRNLTRRSYVTHYCPATLAPGYFDYARNSGKIACGDGCYYSYVIRG